MGEEDRWKKLEEIVRRVVREEISALKKKPKIELIEGAWVGITKEQLAAWRKSFPALDLEAELNRAAGWILANEKLAPRDFGRFIFNWCSKGQNQASLRSIPTRREDPGPGKKLCAYCDQVSTGLVNGISHCRAHGLDAMDCKPIPRMKGVEPKAVAGRD